MNRWRGRLILDKWMKGGYPWKFFIVPVYFRGNCQWTQNCNIRSNYPVSSVCCKAAEPVFVISYLILQYMSKYLDSWECMCLWAPFLETKPGVDLSWNAFCHVFPLQLKEQLMKDVGLFTMMVKAVSLWWMITFTACIWPYMMCIRLPQVFSSNYLHLPSSFLKPFHYYSPIFGYIFKKCYLKMFTQRLLLATHSKYFPKLFEKQAWF